LAFLKAPTPHSLTTAKLLTPHLAVVPEITVGALLVVGATDEDESEEIEGWGRRFEHW
jgi:hypothetical protein